ncbi:MAG: hypothetical protein Q9164_006442 [Protoblastenia rupestris]
MARRAQDLLEQISRIARTNASLSDELSTLEKNLDNLNNNAELSLELPNKILAQLTSLLDISALEDVPTEQKSSWWTLLWPKRSPESLLKSSVASTISNLVQVEEMAEATAQESNECQLRAAHLAHEAAVQEDDCWTSLGQLSLEKQRAQQQLNEFITKASSNRSEMAFSRRVKESMEAEVQCRDERAENHKKWLRRTWWVPGVNLVTVPVTVARGMHHMKEIEICEDVVDNMNEEMTTLESSMEELEAQITNISKIQHQLEKATSSCTGIEMQSKWQMNEAKKLVGQFQGILTKSSDVREALKLFQKSDDSQSLRDIRLKVLRSVIALSRHLLDHNLLAEGQKASTIRLVKAHELTSQKLEDRDVIASVSAYKLPLLDDF